MSKQKLFVITCLVISAPCLLIAYLLDMLFPGNRMGEITAFVMLFFLWIAKKGILENDENIDKKVKHNLIEEHEGLKNAEKELNKIDNHILFLQSESAKKELDEEQRLGVLEAFSKDRERVIKECNEFKRRLKDLRHETECK